MSVLNPIIVQSGGGGECDYCDVVFSVTETSGYYGYGGAILRGVFAENRFVGTGSEYISLGPYMAVTSAEIEPENPGMTADQTVRFSLPKSDIGWSFIGLVALEVMTANNTWITTGGDVLPIYTVNASVYTRFSASLGRVGNTTGEQLTYDGKTISLADFLLSQNARRGVQNTGWCVKPSSMPIYSISIEGDD